MATDEMEVVSALRAALAENVGRERFELWFGSATRLELTDGSLNVGVASPFLVEFLRSNFRRPLEDACRRVLGKVPGLRFHVAPDSSDDAPGGSAPAPPQNANGNPKKPATAAPDTTGLPKTL